MLSIGSRLAQVLNVRSAILCGVCRVAANVERFKSLFLAYLGRDYVNTI